MSYNNKVHLIGRITVLCAIIANFLPIAYLAIFHGLYPTFSEFLNLYSMVAATYFVTWIIQPISYFPALGTAGSYIGWTVGNVADLRLPAIGMAQKISGYEEGTEEGDLMSVFAICTSVFVNVALMGLFTLVGSTIIPMLPTFVRESFSYIVVAVFGAILVDRLSRNFKRNAIICLAGVVTFFVVVLLGGGTGTKTIGVIVVAMLVSILLDTAGKKKA